MSHSRDATVHTRPRGSLVGRIGRAWPILGPQRRLAVFAAIALFLTLFLPWYQETVIASSTTPALRSASASLTGWGAFSFVEAAVLLVAVGVLVLLFERAEGRAFHVPGGDGGVITAAGLWTCLLIVWRMFDKEGTTGHGQYATTAGIEWGIFVALGAAGLLAYAGSRIRSVHEPEPPLPGEPPAPSQQPRARRTPDGEERTSPPAAKNQVLEQRPRRPRTARSSSRLNFSDLDAIRFDDPPEAPTVRRATPPPEAPTAERPPGAEDQLTIELDGSDAGK